MSVAADLKRLRSDVGDLVARHEKAKGARDFTKYAEDPAGFFRDVLRCEPWAKQVEMAEAVRDYRRTVVVTSNGCGKDWATARIALWHVYARRGFVILTGPTDRQVRNILMREVRRAFAMAPELPGELFTMELRVGQHGEAGMLAFTSDNADKLTGFHHPRLLVCMTEGQGVEEEAYEAAIACCTGEENRLFVYGNPTRPAGAFYRAATAGVEKPAKALHAAHDITTDEIDVGKWHVITIPASAHPNVITGRPEIPGAVSREWIAALRDEYGESSSIYRARVLARFPEESVEGLIRREWIRAAFNRYEDGTLADAAAWAPPLLALDVARFGPDSTVLADVRGPVVQKLITWRGASITETADRVIAHAESVWLDRQKPPPRIVVDEPGLGGGAIDVLRRKGWNVRAFNGAAKPIDETRFLNARAESHWVFRTLLENGRIALPRDAALEEEALAIEWQINQAHGTIQILSKDVVRAAIGRSPDKLDAVVIGLAQTVGNLRRMMSVHTLRM